MRGISPKGLSVMNRVHGCKVFSAALAVMLVGCSQSAAGEAPAATQNSAPTAAPPFCHNAK